MAKKHRKLLRDNEIVIHDAFYTIIPHVFRCIVVLILAILLAFVLSIGLHVQTWKCAVMVGVVLLIELLVLGVRRLRASAQHLIVTNQRIVGQSGTSSIFVMNMPLTKLQDVEITQSLLGRKCNYGEILFSDTSGVDYSFQDVKDITHVKEMVLAQKHQIEHGAS